MGLQGAAWPSPAPAGGRGHPRGKEVALQVPVIATESGPSEGSWGDSVATWEMQKGTCSSLVRLRLCTSPGAGAVLSPSVAQRDPCLCCNGALVCKPPPSSDAQLEKQGPGPGLQEKPPSLAAPRDALSSCCNSGAMETQRNSHTGVTAPGKGQRWQTRS